MKQEKSNKGSGMGEEEKNPSKGRVFDGYRDRYGDNFRNNRGSGSILEKYSKNAIAREKRDFRKKAVLISALTALCLFVLYWVLVIYLH